MDEAGKTSLRTIMRALAVAIRDGRGVSAWPSGVPAPIVYLDAIADGRAPAPEEEGAPVVVIAGTGDTGGAGRSDTGYSVEVLVAIDAASRDANAVPSQDLGGGIRETCDGDRLQAVVNAVTEAIRGTDAGAVLSQIDRRWSFHTAPVQFATLSLSYTSPATFGDVDDAFDTFS